MWLKESNRLAHLKYGAYSSFIGTILFATGLAVGMEFKDCHYANGDTPILKWNWSNFDWLDFLATILGGVVGQLLQILLIILIL